MPSRTVLIIDDESAIRLSIAAYLEDSGFRCLEAANGREGLEILVRESPDILVTDLRMPEIDGFSLLGLLRAQHLGTPVIVLTGTGDAQASTEALRLGARDCLFKPLNDLGMLVTAIQAILDHPEPSDSGR